MSQKSARLLQQFLQQHHVSKSEFCRITGIGRTSLYKYLKGEPIHPLKARQIEERILKQYRTLIKYENLID